MIVRRGGEYRTVFASAESPISEGGRWLNANVNGGGWTPMVTTAGRAFGTQTGSKPPYDDSLCLLQPTPGTIWSANQDLIARVFLTSRAGWSGGFHEVELHLRGNIVGTQIQTYEVVFSMNAGTTYCEITQWKGPLGLVSGDIPTSFWFLKSNTSFTSPADGSYIRAKVTGNIIQAFTSPDGITWTECITQHDITSTDLSGNTVIPLYNGLPGYGHWKNDTADVAATYGISDLWVKA